MKISLNMGRDQGPEARKQSQNRSLEADIKAVKGGDWEAKNNLARSFMPLLTKLAEKRTSNTEEINSLITAGKEGLYTAAKKYKSSIGASDFQLFALEFIENSMDRAGKSGGLLGRLFGR